ncbi:MAG TPA: Spy/CpxP family protein refolding chaperone [Terriglobia bacterium]|nr:Spy/CpxP family protein refolding chaperone [Terriglobia bacterium]
MKTKLSKLLMMAIMLSLTGLMVFAQSDNASQSAPPPPGPAAGPPFGWHDRPGGRMGGMMAALLGLSPDQKSQIQSIHSAQRTTMQPLMAQEASLRQQLRQVTEATTFNQAQVQALATQMAQIQIQMTVARAQVEWKVFNVLTPDQQSKLTQFQQQMEQERQGRMNGQNPTS